MGPTEIVDLSSDDESETVCLKAVKLEGDFVMDKKCQSHTTGQDSEENLSSNGPSTGHSNSSVLEQGPSPVDDTCISYVSPIGAAPLCRQFWKAGNYDDGIGSKVTVQNAKNYLHVHPMFLHSNATSHKWAFGAIAELLDNAVDEIQNGATFVIVDKTSNPRDGSPALLIQDDGGGMDPEAMRRCMSFGFSDKKSQFAIGRYGNGFKTSTMRLGADVIVFSCHLNNRILTQSIGLLSYTYLTQTQLDRIVVPMVNYEFNTSTGSLEVLNGNDHFVSNLSLLLRWSPYSSEADLLKQFDEIGSHGTKVIIYNLWCNDDGNLELDFDTNSKVVFIIFFWFYFFLLYFVFIILLCLLMRGNSFDRSQQLDFLRKLLKSISMVSTYITRIDSYWLLPKRKGDKLSSTTMFKCMHFVNHGLSPFGVDENLMNIVRNNNGGQGILQADFIEPTHNKQDFERTSLFQKLEVRLKEMTWEYWDTHCTLFGYKKEKRKFTPGVTSMQNPLTIEKPVILNKSSSSLVNAKAYGNSLQCSKNLQSLDQGSQSKRKKTHELVDLMNTQEHASTDNVACVGFSQNKQTMATPADQVGDQKNLHLIHQNKQLHAKCLEFEKTGEELNLKVVKLKSKIQEAQDEYKRLLAEIKSLDVKEE
ncbi:hypothetical protein ACSQ67_019560 [Phaseolus vulgaris]